MTKQATLLYFSPTGTTRKVLEYIAAGTGLPVCAHDLTVFAKRWRKYTFAAGELVLLGLPVYYGLLPPIADEFFRGLQGAQTPAVYVVTYGNRDYENALLELKDRAEAAGFFGLAAIAAIGEHALADRVATGRPDEEDRKLLRQFGQKIRQKYFDYLEKKNSGTVSVPGSRPYFKTVINQIVVETNSECDACGLCAGECPVCAINPANTSEIDQYRCLGCLRCVRTCPRKAKFLNPEIRNSINARLKKCTAERRKPELFI